MYVCMYVGEGEACIIWGGDFWCSVSYTTMSCLLCFDMHCVSHIEVSLTRHLFWILSLAGVSVI